MQKVNFNITQELVEKIDEAVEKWGFSSRAEFFRFATVDFIRNDARLMPADDVLRDHAKTIRSVKARQDLAELRKDWYKRKKD